MDKELLFKNIQDIYNSTEYREWCYEYHFVPFHVTTIMSYLKTKGVEL